MAAGTWADLKNLDGMVRFEQPHPVEVTGKTQNRARPLVGESRSVGDMKGDVAVAPNRYATMSVVVSDPTPEHRLVESFAFFEDPNLSFRRHMGADYH